jgi:acyl-CoA reductase-like NAD-dependent aldehyde dehydrogenase
LEAGLPEGVFNVVTGYGETAGAALANHHDVDKITFTGSTEVGRLLLRAAAGNLKKVSLELGGKSPNIVFADADVEAALKGVFMGIFFCQGEICSAGSRLFVEESIYDNFVARLADMAKAVKLGHGLDPDTKMGPLVSRAQQQRVLDYVRIGKEQKANAVAGGILPTARSPTVTSLSRPCSRTSQTTCASRSEEILARSCAQFHSRICRTPLRKETIHPLVSLLACGRRTFAKPIRPPPRSKPAPSG